jgi:UDP-4-amino-4-deoxy-L-arabinose formyltransferase/UDP-glucuronic acid dehydrogenase (UDP-4-keto-hexauronic acid decarboxylating)
MRVVVLAYHNMGIAGLDALERAGYEIACIFSHEDDPGENCWFASVREWGQERGIPVESPDEIRRAECAEKIAGFHPEMIFSFYYRHMIPERILRIPPKGAYNLHGSLLPAYRGRCPVNWVLVHGEERTGVTLHHMVPLADAGDIVGQRVVPIAQEDTAFTLYGKLCLEAGILLDEFLPLMKIGRAPRIPQDLSLGSYFGGRRPEDGRIDWGWPATRIYNLIRAVTDPYPGTFCALPDGSRLMIWWGTPDAGGGGEEKKPPGSIEMEGNSVFVRTGEGRIRLLDLQERGERMTGDGIIRYFTDKEGMKLS